MKNVTFLVTNQCNFNCRHCFVNGGLPLTEELSFKEKLDAIEMLSCLGTKKLTFSGGEPLLDKNLQNLIVHTKELGMDVGLLSNGMLLTQKRSRKLIKLLDSLSLSLYTNDILGLKDAPYAAYLEHMTDLFVFLTAQGFPFKITIPVSCGGGEACRVLLRRIVAAQAAPKAVRLFMVTPLGRCGLQSEFSTESENCFDLVGDLRCEEDTRGIPICYEYSHIPTGSGDLKFQTDCPIRSYASDDLIRSDADPHMDANGDLYLCGLLLRQEKYCVGNVKDDSAETIANRIGAVATTVRERSARDCCPALNRRVGTGRRLVCPILYF